MKGISGIAGPQIHHDTVLTARFESTQGLTPFFSVSCGVVPDGTFTGDLTLGKSVFHKWRISFDGNVDLAQRETVKLRNFENKPTLVPCDRVSKAYFAHTASAARKTAGEPLPQQKADALAGRWGKGTLVDDPQIRNYLNGYITKFPGLFDPAK
jgi:hypothetical protein